MGKKPIPIMQGENKSRQPHDNQKQKIKILKRSI